MSSVSVIRYSPRHARSIDAWLARHSAAEEIHRIDLGDARLVIVSPQAARGVRGPRFFRGIAVDEERIRFRAGETRDEGTGVETGMFVEVDWSEPRRVRVRRDRYGCQRLVSTAGQGFSAASDSLAVLGSLRRALGAELTVHADQLWARSLLSLAAAQQISDATMFREIDFVPGNRAVDLLRGETRLSAPSLATVDRLDQPELDQPPSEAYASAVQGAARVLARLSRSLRIGSPGWGVELALSGGYDSRVLLAAAHAVGEPLVCFARATASGDYERAQDLATAAGLSFEDEEDAYRGAPSDQPRLSLWGASLAGLYDGFAPPHTVRRGQCEGERRVVMNGVGMEMGTGTGWGLQRWCDLTHQLTPPRRGIAARVQEEFLRAGHRGLRAAGYPAEDPHGSHLVYASYRGPLHGAGGLGPHTATFLAPLMSPTVLSAAAGNRSKRMPFDLTLVLSPEVASRPYLDPTFALTGAAASRRLRELGGALDPTTVDPLEVVGSLDDVVQGPTRLGMSITTELGMTGDYPAAVAWLRDDLELLPEPELRPVYAEISANGQSQARRNVAGSAPTGYALPKAASLRLLRLAGPASRTYRTRERVRALSRR